MHLARLRSSGAIVFKPTCEVCGEQAINGFDCTDPIGAVRAKLDGDHETARHKFGRWYCGEHSYERGEDHERDPSAGVAGDGRRVEIEGVGYAPGEVWAMPVIRIADAIARGVIVEVRE